MDDGRSLTSFARTTDEELSLPFRPSSLVSCHSETHKPHRLLEYQHGVGHVDPVVRRRDTVHERRHVPVEQVVGRRCHEPDRYAERFDGVHYTHARTLPAQATIGEYNGQ